ncbi:energy transducer TonB [Methylomicrobium sp. RS1]|uniref:energy transducer TonB n=1 Tax=Candidatus Methylomicrobium oryzae TaxID=2802053 RepID=UPI001920EB10|nr:energy transducer TonB [Methylomicrobium sp. RS1]MBL1264902.1 energy transducer TonB [Methylomicrobium sp. RS1]
MQFFKIRENAPGESRNESARLSQDGGSVNGDSLHRQLIFIFLGVLLVHGVLIAYLQRTPVTETPAEPLVMAVELLTAPAPQAAKPAPLAPPVEQPKPQPKPVKPKKAPVPPKKPQVVRKPVTAPPEPKAVPAAKAETAVSVPTPAPTAMATRPQPPVPAAPPAQPKAEPFTEANYRANYKSNPKPEYPRLAKSRGWQGRVLLRVQVTAEGRSAAVSVQQSSGHELLDEAAVEAVRNWTFIPAKRGDTPVASAVTVPIQFKLNE